MVAEFSYRGIAKKDLDEYYMVELPWIIERWRRHDARDALRQFMIIQFQCMEEDKRNAFHKDLVEQAYGPKNSPAPEEQVGHKLDKLREYRQRHQAQRGG